MGKKIAITMGIVLLLLVVGLLVSRFLINLEDNTEPKRAAPTLKDTDNSAEVAETQTAAPTPEEVIPAQPPSINVVSVDGKVERRMGDEPWVPLQPGDSLLQEEAIRAGKEGRAVFDVGETATVEITPRSQFSVKEVTHTVARLQLDVGRISAVVHGEGDSKLKIATKGSDAVAEAAQGEFSVLTRGDGKVAVATHKGDVILSAKNKTVTVAAGSQSVVQPKSAPAAPEPIPASLFLKVARPKTLLQREKKTTIEGTSTPGALISVNGVDVQTDEAGNFSAEVGLKEGKNPIVVESEDASGRRKKKNLSTITVKSRLSEVKSHAGKWGRAN